MHQYFVWASFPPQQRRFNYCDLVTVKANGKNVVLMAILTAGLAAQAALSNLHKIDDPSRSCICLEPQDTERKEEGGRGKKGEEKDKENALCRV